MNFVVTEILTVIGYCYNIVQNAMHDLILGKLLSKHDFVFSLMHEWKNQWV